jgi:hypothetical protein
VSRRLANAAIVAVVAVTGCGGGESEREKLAKEACETSWAYEGPEDECVDRFLRQWRESGITDREIDQFMDQVRPMRLRLITAAIVAAALIGGGCADDKATPSTTPSASRCTAHSAPRRTLSTTAAARTSGCGRSSASTLPPRNARSTAGKRATAAVPLSGRPVRAVGDGRPRRGRAPRRPVRPLNADGREGRRRRA